MIRLTTSGKIAYQMFNQIVILLVLYACLMLLSALRAIPYSTLIEQVPASFVTGLATRIFHLVLLSGIVTGGMAMCTHDRNMISYLRGLYRLWWGYIVATLILSGLEIAPLLELVTSLLLFAYLGVSAYCGRATPFLRVWQVGMMLTIGSLLSQFVVHGDWQAVVALFRIYVGYGICGVSIMFWLMTHWSNVRVLWARDGVYIVASLIGLSGLLISLARLGLHPGLGVLSAFMIPICYMIFAGHHYRALKDRTHDQSLSAHWIAIAVLFWMAGGGFLGTLSTQGNLPLWIGDTQLASAQIGWMMWGILAIILSLVNYQAATLRGENRRVTGYMPLWLITFGHGLALLVQSCMGVVEIYLSRIVGIDPAHVTVLLLPMQLVWMICLLAVAIGIGIYALGYWKRRPKTILLAS